MLAADDEKQIPQLPADWSRCHAYNDRKRRYCRQMPAPGFNYCGNHLHLIEGHEAEGHKKRVCGEESSSSSNKKNKKDRGARVPCPIDPSHLIFESALAKHVLVCPAAKQKEETCSREYYRHDTNRGGFGELGDTYTGEDVETDLGRAKILAMAVLKVFCSIFPSALSSAQKESDGRGNLSDNILKCLTEDDIYNALPEVDHSKSEEGIANDISKHRIKAGGPRHLHQIASILGHVRQNGLIATNDNTEQAVIVEMGAGRGMLGLVIASAIGAAQVESTSSSKVKLCLVERSGTRGKAETKIRTAVGSTMQNNSDDNLRLDRVDVARIKCDLAHAHMSTALPLLSSKEQKSRSVVVAKHLCGSGTDLALKSLRDIARTGKVDGCIMATCCHGLCTWSDYVGRECLLNLFCSVGGLPKFGVRDFNQLKRWTSASVLENGNAGTDQQRQEEEGGEGVNDEHKVGNADTAKGKSQNIFSVVKELNLACGGRGLGRACQRLIDYGRTDYIKKHLFEADLSKGKVDVSLCHYCSSEITPQNALIIAKRKSA
ncbi:hypothetical protein ACHAWC_006273 [Mediolabrus comicus]